MFCRARSIASNWARAWDEAPVETTFSTVSAKLPGARGRHSTPRAASCHPVKHRSSTRKGKPRLSIRLRLQCRCQIYSRCLPASACCRRDTMLDRELKRTECCAHLELATACTVRSLQDDQHASSKRYLASAGLYPMHRATKWTRSLRPRRVSCCDVTVRCRRPRVTAALHWPKYHLLSAPPRRPSMVSTTHCRSCCREWVTLVSDATAARAARRLWTA
mmetsp:Transcript_80822/g.215710  ORF Transcript_80822/g.215710 Transcript_80822/m.215710 type:complete len:219 (+) Transcript_80822:377-1033(+)